VFTRVASRDVGPLRLIVPDWASLDVAALVLVAVALVLQFRFNTGVVTLLAACAGLSVAIAWAGTKPPTPCAPAASRRLLSNGRCATRAST
jgi:hypothetical protein